MAKIHQSPIGLTVWHDAEEEKFPYTITGNPSRKFTVIDFESAYDFEELVKSKVQHVGITFDSEYSQFFAYAKTENLAMQFVSNIENYFAKVRDMLNVNTEV